MKLGASRRAFSFEGRQELAPVKAFKCKSPTAFGRELHDACKGPSGKEQRKGTRSVANLVNAIHDSTTCLQLAVFSQSSIYLDEITLCLSASSNSQSNSQSNSPARWSFIIHPPFSHTVHTLFHLKRFRGTKRIRKPIWCNLKRLFGTKLTRILMVQRLLLHDFARYYGCF